MDDRLLDLFVSEVETHSKFVVGGTMRLREALEGDNHNEPWYHLHAVLNAAANLSKIFWGSAGKLEAQRAPLRAFLAVGDDSALRDPDLRNDFEHFDQRLDRWYSENPCRPYVGRNIGPIESAPIPYVPGEWFQHFDPVTGLVTFWDHQVSILHIEAEAVRLVGLIRELREHRW